VNGGDMVMAQKMDWNVLGMIWENVPINIPWIAEITMAPILLKIADGLPESSRRIIEDR
jgi:hypothetical protein